MVVGTKVYVPSIDQIVTVVEVENKVPVRGSYIDTEGDVNYVDLITKTWQILTLLKELWIIIRQSFKKKQS
jgi:hypothetical protein